VTGPLDFERKEKKERCAFALEEMRPFAGTRPSRPFVLGEKARSGADRNSFSVREERQAQRGGRFPEKNQRARYQDPEKSAMFLKGGKWSEYRKGIPSLSLVFGRKRAFAPGFPRGGKEWKTGSSTGGGNPFFSKEGARFRYKNLRKHCPLRVKRERRKR